jgi:hypothetical protein
MRRDGDIELIGQHASRVCHTTLWLIHGRPLEAT